jgi:hypothetical protein
MSANNSAKNSIMSTKSTRNSTKSTRNGTNKNNKENKTRKTKATLRISNKKTNKTYRYTTEHYQSNDGMLTSVWGPSTWHMLHSMSFNYPIQPTCEEKRNYMNFVLSLQRVLPCGKCRSNLKKNFKKLPLSLKDMESRHHFSLYVYRLHEVVNGMLGKKSGLSFEDVRDRYEHFRARCKKTKTDLEKENKLKENGCTEPIYGYKTKCVLKIVPQETKCESFQIISK